MRVKRKEQEGRKKGEKRKETIPLFFRLCLKDMFTTRHSLFIKRLLDAYTKNKLLILSSPKGQRKKVIFHVVLREKEKGFIHVRRGKMRIDTSC